MKNLVITGDSLSYNRYGYDDTPRINATDCHIGMNSWSFKLRKKFISSAPGFKYGDELKFDENRVLGLGDGIDDIDSIFGKRVVTIAPKNGLIHFEAESDTGEIYVYFQCRPNNYCRFKVFVDEKSAQNSVETYCPDSEFSGYALKTVKLSCDKEKRVHKIVFSDFEATELEPLVTIAGISTAPRYAYTTGQGSRTAKFLLYHFEERIAKYSPDMLILIFGGNDLLFYSKEEYRTYLEKILKRTKERFPTCKILSITIPPSGKVKDEIRGIKIESDEALNFIIDDYNKALEEVSEKYGALCIKQKDIFKGMLPEDFRFDNVHLSKTGNNMLYDEIHKILF